MEIVQSWNWFLGQTLATQVLIVVGLLNIIVVGLKQLGLTQVADFCQTLENALVAMTSAAKTAFVAEIKKPNLTEVLSKGESK